MLVLNSVTNITARFDSTKYNEQLLKNWKVVHATKKEKRHKKA